MCSRRIDPWLSSNLVPPHIHTCLDHGVHAFCTRILIEQCLVRSNLNWVLSIFSPSSTASNTQCEELKSSMSSSVLSAECHSQPISGSVGRSDRRWIAVMRSAHAHVNITMTSRCISVSRSKRLAGRTSNVTDSTTADH